MLTLTCQHCAAVFSDTLERKGPRRKYCSHKCGMAHWRDGHRPAKAIRSCELCGTEFSGRNNSRYCKPLCARRAIHQRKYVPKGRPDYRGIRDHKDDLIAMYKAGSTLEQIGQKYGVTRERVRQIISQYGISRDDGGIAAQVRARREERIAKRNRLCVVLRGMPYDEFKNLNDARRWGGYKKTPIHAFTHQRKNANSRRVPFKFIFADWWAVWAESGKFSERGCSRDAYVMCRFNDEGAYEKGNVYISTLRLNSVLGRSLAHDRAKPRTEAFNIVRAAGGRAAVAQAFGISPTTVSQYMNNGRFPFAWIESGGIQKLADMTEGAYSADRIIEVATKKYHETNPELKRVA